MRLRGMRPRLVRIVAPAGYGKSTLARQYLEGQPAVAVCDCFGVRGAAEMLARLDAALRAPSEAPSAPALAAHVAALRGHLSMLSSPMTLLLENAEALADEREAREVVASLLSVHGAPLRVVICSRVRLPLRYARIAGPDESAFVGIDDLRLNHDEVAALLGTWDGATIARVEALTEGWPIVISMLARLAQTAPLSEVLARLEYAEFEALDEYLLDEVLGQLGERVIATILACVASVDRRLGDVRLLRECGVEMATIAEMLQRCCLVVPAGAERCEVHPLLRDALLRARGAALIEMRVRLADALRAQGAPLRAAALYFALEDNESAAAAIAMADGFTTYDDRDLVRAIMRLDRETLLRYPPLWSAVVAKRLAMVPQEEILDEALIVWSRVDAATPADLRSRLTAIVVTVALELGRIDTAEATLAADDAWADGDRTSAQRALRDVCGTYIAVARCAAVDEERFERVAAVLGGDPSIALYHRYRVSLALAMHRGDAGAVRRICERVHAFDDSAIAYLNGDPLVAVAFSQWLIGDDANFERTLVRLEGAPATAAHRNRCFIESARGRNAFAEPDGRPSVRVCAGLLAAARTPDLGQRNALLRRCIADARASNSPWWRGLSLLAATLIDGEHRAQHIQEAHGALQGADAEPLREAFDALSEGREFGGFVSAFAARFAPSADGEPTFKISVSLAHGSIAINGKPAALGGRRLELVLLLAGEGRPIHRSDLLERLWPRSNASSAGNALRVLLSRLRKDLGRDTLRRIGEYYVLDPAVDVDLDVLEARLRAVGAGRTLTPQERAGLGAELNALCADGFAPALPEWLSAAETRTSTVRSEIATVLHEDAMGGADYERAYGVGRMLLDHDACDELGCELAMRALLAAGDLAGARRELNAYAEALRMELGAPPAERLYRLLEP
ncbi:hypothetical protein EPN42_00290 [bacterium]|nr:MAG: hypothetical protein EPN42_00290 [bacterium]